MMTPKRTPLSRHFPHHNGAILLLFSSKISIALKIAPKWRDSMNFDNALHHNVLHERDYRRIVNFTPINANALQFAPIGGVVDPRQKECKRPPRIRRGQSPTENPQSGGCIMQSESNEEKV